MSSTTKEEVEPAATAESNSSSYLSDLWGQLLDTTQERVKAVANQAATTVVNEATATFEARFQLEIQNIDITIANFIRKRRSAVNPNNQKTFLQEILTPQTLGVLFTITGAFLVFALNSQLGTSIFIESFAIYYLLYIANFTVFRFVIKNWFIAKLVYKIGKGIMDGFGWYRSVGVLLVLAVVQYLHTFCFPFGLITSSVNLLVSGSSGALCWILTLILVLISIIVQSELTESYGGPNFRAGIQTLKNTLVSDGGGAGDTTAITATTATPKVVGVDQQQSSDVASSFTTTSANSTPPARRPKYVKKKSLTQQQEQVHYPPVVDTVE